MAVRVNTRIIVNSSHVISRYSSRYSQAQKWLDNEVIKDTTPYVPMRTGALYRSAMTASAIGAGQVVYSTPYARRLYFGNFNFSKVNHPQATAQWFEKAKAVHKTKWIHGVDRIMRGAGG